MNNTQLHIQANTFSLKRFPNNPFDKSLRAWDAADEYIINHVADTINLSELAHIVIVNDSFGALTCAMAKLSPQANISVYTDSYMSMRAIAQNLKGSNLDKNNVTMHSSLMLSELAGKSVDLVLLKVPRTLSYLDYLLFTLSQTLGTASNTGQSPIVIGGAMVKLVTSSVMNIFNAHMGNTTTSLARKKARLIFAECAVKTDNGGNVAQTLSLNPHCIHEVQDKEIDLTLHNYPNVFCRDQVDIGARYMLKVLPSITRANQVVIDLGCGNGILGTSLLLQNAANAPKMIYIDESFMAIESAKVSLNNSTVDERLKARAEFLVGHCLDEFINHSEDSSGNLKGVDLILCNPPFHQQNTIIDDIAWQMFTDAKKALKVGGELRIVGNRHLDHRAKLKKLFGACEIIASDAKFVVLSAIKQRARA